MRSALLIARKDMRQRLKDKSALLYGIVAPMGLAFIFSLVFGPLQDSSFNAEYVVVDMDGGTISQAFVSVLDGLEDEGIATVRAVDTVAEARTQVEAGSDAFSSDDVEKANAAFVIPAGTSDSVMADEAAEITVIGGAGSELASQIAYSLAQGFAAEIGAVQVSVGTVLQDGPPEQLMAEVAAQLPPPGTQGFTPELAAEMAAGLIAADLAAEAAETENPITVDDVSANTKQLDQVSYLSASMAIFFLFFSVAFGVSGILEERRLGTLDRLLAAPMSRRSILVGKMLSAFVLGIVSLTVLWLGTTFLLDADWGNPLGVIPLIIAGVLAAMGILSIVAAFAKNQDQAGNFQAIVSLVLAFLGGAFFPVNLAGGILETLSLATPHAWFLRGLGDLQGGQVSDILPSVAALLVFAVVTGGIAWPFMRRAVER